LKTKIYIVLIFLAILSVPTRLASQDSLQLNTLQKAYNQASSDSARLKILMKLINTSALHNVDTALQLAHKALEMAVKLNDTFKVAYSLQSIAGYYTVQSNHKEALRYDLEALKMYRKLNLIRKEALTLNSIGEDYYNLDLFNEAFDYYRQSFEKAKEAEYPLVEAIATYNLGRVLMSMDQMDKAKEYIENSMQLSEQIGDIPGIAYSKLDLAEIHINKKNYDLAAKELLEAYKLSLQTKEDVLTPQILAKMAKTYDHIGDYTNALKHYDDALEIYQRQKNKNGIGEIYFGKGNVSLNMGDETGAKAFYEKCLDTAGEVQDNELMIKCYKLLSILYETDRNFEVSLKYYKKYKSLEDSVFSEKKKEQFAQIQVQYETSKKDIEIELLNKNEDEQLAKLKNEEFIRNILVVILAFTGVLLFSLYKNGEKRRKINEVLVQQRKEIESKGKELSSLLEMKDKFFSIISHDLRSPINALVGVLDILDGGNLTQSELNELSRSLKVRLNNTRKLLDTLLDWAMLQMNEIKIQNEVINLSSIVDENMMFFREVADKKLEFINLVNKEDLVKADHNMLDLIIRNLISNSIKFTKEGGKVEVSTEKGDEDSIVVLIKDNGVGISAEQIDKLFDTTELYTTRGTANEKGTGLGLRLCKEFVERMGGKIWVESTEGEGSTFKFTINKA
jgi:signal transduction histidine kinase/Tfp pilus assembly protein PilF